MNSAVFGLILCNILWSLAYPMTKHLLNQGYENLEVAFLRYFLGFILLGSIYLFSPKRRATDTPRDSKTLFILFGIGLFSFYLTPLCQITGLQIGRAMDSSLMIAIEPLSVIILAMIIFKDRLNRFQVLGIVFAIAGALIVSEVTPQKILEFKDTRLIANLLFIISTVSEAMYSILSRFVMTKRSPTFILLVALLAGLVLLFTHNMILNPSHLSGFTTLVVHSNLKELLLLLFLGWGATAFGYLYWLKVMEKVPISLMAVSLYIQPVLGAIFSSVLLGEKTSIYTYTGSTLIFLGIYLATKRLQA